MRLSSLFVMLVCVCSVLSGCRGEKDEPSPDQPRPKVARTLLIYAVATNSLSGDMTADRIEMQKVAMSVAGLGKDVNVLLYEAAYRSKPALYQLTTKPDKINGEEVNGSFQKIREYDSSRFSTDPLRISEVIADVTRLRPADNYGLVLWSHATGWTPNFSDHTFPQSKPQQIPQRAFGQDKGPDGNYNDWCDITDLQRAIPTGLFDFIWCDCCYMSSIEVAYQLRDKCRYMVAYPSEDWAYGMPYDVTLPMIAREKPDLEGASKAFFDWYDSGLNWPVTICMVDMQKIGKVAETTRRIYEEGIRPESSHGLLCYSRGSVGPFYDFAQYTRSFLNVDDTALKVEDEGTINKWKVALDSFNAAMDDFVVLALTGTRNFDGRPWAYENYSGLSVHFPGTVEGDKEAYYRTLDWWNAVYE